MTTTRGTVRALDAIVAPGRWRALVLGACTLVAMAGLSAEIGQYTIGLGEEAVEAFSLSYEANVPTWYASVLLFCCALALFSAAQREKKGRAAWWVLGAIFVYMSLDEAIEIHEYLHYVAEEQSVFYFAWVIPAAVIVVVLGILFVPFLHALPPITRLRFIVAGAVYVGGALVMEIPLGAWTERFGDENLGYGLIDFVEESMELFGASFFLLAILAHREREVA